MLTTRTLGEICDEGAGVVRTGPFGSQLHESDYSDFGTPVIMPKDIIEGKVSEVSIARVSSEHVERLAQHKLLPGDIVYGRRGDIGRQALITDRESGWLCGTGCLRITPGDAAVNSIWLHYYLREEQVIAFIAQQAVGATMPNLNTSILRSIPISYPDKPTQRRIASILSAYDELIENNTRRIAILEEIARKIYEEWFVRFRFPGHEQVKMVESDWGLIPEGWEVATLSDILQFIGGAQPPKSEHIYEYQPGYIRFVQNRDYGSARHLTYIRESKKNKICDRFDIMVDKYGEAGKTRYGIAGAYNVALAKAAPNKPLHREWLRGFLSQDKFRQYLANASQAATRASLNSAHFNVPVAVPDDQLLAAYEAMALPMLKLILTLSDKNANLRSTRDLLLPKLISGELDVSNLPEPEEENAA